MILILAVVLFAGRLSSHYRNAYYLGYLNRVKKPQIWTPKRRAMLPMYPKRRLKRSLYFHDIYQQYSPNYSNYASPHSSGGNSSDIEKLLQIHRRIRGRSISWNSNIASLAKVHASTCPSGHARLPHGASGQNMAWVGTYEDSANMWASEGHFYTHLGPGGGHYQIMQNYKTVGCGMSKSCNVVVCNYQ